MTWTELPHNVESYLRNVRVKNVGEKDAVLYYNSIPYIIRAGDSASVPFEVVVTWLGDPRSGPNPQVVTFHGEKTWIPTRESEVTRLRQLYGMHNLGGEQEIITGIDPDTERTIDYPRIEVTDGQGNRLYTVLEDSTGEIANGGAIVSPHEIRVKNERDILVERLERELALLKDQVNRQYAVPTDSMRNYVEMSESDLPSDEAPDPTVAPLPQRPGDKVDWGTTLDTP